jgi:hypothetical protein
MNDDGSTSVTDSVVTETSIYTSYSYPTNVEPSNTQSLSVQEQAPQPTLSSKTTASTSDDEVEKECRHSDLAYCDGDDEPSNKQSLSLQEQAPQPTLSSKTTASTSDDEDERECRHSDLAYYDGDDEDDFEYDDGRVYETWLDETEFDQGLNGYMEGFAPPRIHDVSSAFSARRKFSDELIPAPVKEELTEELDRVCVNCGGQADGCAGGKFCI